MPTKLALTPMMKTRKQTLRSKGQLRVEGMRTNRKADEDFFVQKFMKYFRTEIDINASEVREVTDKADLAISSLGRVIGVEFSQLPSSYIIGNFHKKRPTPTYSKNRI